MTTGAARPLTGWVGGYTSDTDGQGIGRLSWDEAGLRITLATEAPDPSYLALSPDGRVLYAVGEQDEGTVSAYAVAGDELRPLGSQPTGGSGPAHVLAHPGGRFVLVANYGSGSVSVHPLGDDGALHPASDLVQHSGSGPVEDRQEGPHAHQVAVSPDGQWLFAVDLGADLVVTYRLDVERGTLTETSRLAVSSGTGPRHLAFSPSGHAAYLVGELDPTLTTLRHQDGVLTVVNSTTVRPAGAEGQDQPAAVVVSPDGKRVRVTNRGDDTVATLALNGGGLLARLVETVPSGGHWPRDLAQSADGSRLLVACEREDKVVGLAVGAEGTTATGGVSSAGDDATASWPSPTCVVLDRS